MDCENFRPNMPLSDQLRVGLSLNRADACVLLLPSDPRHEEYRAALQAKGFKLGVCRRTGYSGRTTTTS
jgi:hypothetical protein